MKKYILSAALLVSVLVYLFMGGTAYAEITGYKVTDGFEYTAAGSTGNGRVIYYKYIGVNFQGGKVLFSHNADGTGATSVGDTIQFVIQNPDTGFQTATIDIHSPNCLSFKPDPEPIDITQYMKKGMNSILVRYLDWCYKPHTISQSYIVYDNTPPITYTPTPSPSPFPSPTPTETPIPTPPPFLELPWDYQSKGMSFVDASLSMSAYFDHQYPILGGGIQEQNDYKDTVIPYKQSNPADISYSSHDGYDYAAKAQVRLGDAVLAAAAGTARYVGSCKPCGNMILIDHANGYQTRYLHLMSEGLISTDSAARVSVLAGQPIGKVGFTGNVDPPGKNGAHIHFGVVQDKNKDGTFDDNVPDGATDPFGWLSPDPDPWATYVFDYYGSQKTGNKSYYLWKHALPGTEGEVSPEGGVFTTHKATLQYPSGIIDKSVQLSMKVTSVDSQDKLVPVGTAYDIQAKTAIGGVITSFLKPFTFIVDFLNYDLSQILPETLSIYSSQDGISWQKEPTTLDLTNKKASATMNHLTQFALFGEKRDISPPVTSAKLAGLLGQSQLYRSSVQLTFTSSDNQGVEYTAYKITNPEGETEWLDYREPQNFSKEGDYTVQYYSVDNAGNTEALKTIDFSIDKTPPEAEIVYDINTFDLTIQGLDTGGISAIKRTELKRDQERVIITDQAGNSLTLWIKDRERGKKAVLNIYSLQYNSAKPVLVNDNRLEVNAQTDRKGQIKELNQLFSVRGEKKLELAYIAKSDKTKVIVRIKRKDIQKEVIAGMKLLRLTTTNGLLVENYNYED